VTDEASSMEKGAGMRMVALSAAAEAARASSGRSARVMVGFRKKI
jgi:hypothetical protein